jgi:hypothetical protein
MPATNATPKENLVASNYRPHNKDGPKTYYVSLVAGGYVLAWEKSGNPTKISFEHRGLRGDEQKWTIEYGDEPNTIALRNVASGEYIRALENKANGKIGTGDREWWEMSVGELTAPGAFRLSTIDPPEKFFLSLHAGGNMYRNDKARTILFTLDVSIFAS